MLFNPVLSIMEKGDLGTSLATKKGKEKEESDEDGSEIDPKMMHLRQLYVIKEGFISVAELQHTPIPEQVREMGWERMVNTSNRMNLNVVHEFYHSIDPKNYKKQGIIVRGVRVHFNPMVLNRYFSTEDFPNYYQGFLAEINYVDDTNVAMAEELRKYPMGKWKGGKQKIRQKELSANLAFWNTFI